MNDLSVKEQIAALKLKQDVRVALDRVSWLVDPVLLLYFNDPSWIGPRLRLPTIWGQGSPDIRAYMVELARGAAIKHLELRARACPGNREVAIYLLDKLTETEYKSALQGLDWTTSYF